MCEFSNMRNEWNKSVFIPTITYQNDFREKAVVLKAVFLFRCPFIQETVKHVHETLEVELTQENS